MQGRNGCSVKVRLSLKNAPSYILRYVRRNASDVARTEMLRDVSRVRILG